jgi:hypothetical protein
VTDKERKMSEGIMSRWGRFVRVPDSGPGWAVWPRVAVLEGDEIGLVVRDEEREERDVMCRV